MLYNAHPAKGFLPGLQALEQVRAGLGGDMRAIIFGTGEPEIELPEWVTFRRDPDRRALIDEIYNACRVFGQPSMYEGFGLTAAEAMACGCALVSTDNGGSRDYAIAGQTALLADTGDVDGLAAGVDQLLRDDGERRRLATNGQSFVQRFQWDRAIEDLEAHLERYIASPAEFQQPPDDDAERRATASHGSIGSFD
jgi:glycosyltransferase involved in cell wall biosynthesis